MTQFEFETYTNLLLTNPNYFYIHNGIAECRGSDFCDHHTCPFDVRELKGDCQLQDRDKLTKAQLNKLNSDYPELFI